METRQQQIIVELGVKPVIDAKQEIEQRTRFLSTKLAQSGLNGFILGISGGQDSLLAGLLAQRAAKQLRDEGHKAEFHAVLLPYGGQADREDALLALEVIQPDVDHDFDIKPGVDGIVNAFEKAEGFKASDFGKGNAKARVRMTAQYLYSGEFDNLLVVGTDHAAEAVTGFFTKYGDGGADILPLTGLNKRQGKALLRELGAPELFMMKAPTADLLDARPGQPDEAELGLSYENDIDDFLEGKAIDPSSARLIIAKFDATEHKRKLPVSYTDGV